MNCGGEGTPENEEERLACGVARSCREACVGRDYAEGTPLEKFRHRPEDFVGYKGKLDPHVVMAKSRELIAELRKPEPVKLTVGDLSFASREKRQRERTWLEKRVNRGNGVTVGDLSAPSPDGGKGLQNLYAGPRPPAPSISKSQEILMRMQGRDREKRLDVARMKTLVRRQQEEGGMLYPGEVAAILRGEVT